MAQSQHPIANRGYYDHSNFVQLDRRKKYSEYVKWKSVTSSRSATHERAQVLQTRRTADREFSSTPVFRYKLVSQQCSMCFLITTSPRLFKKMINIERELCSNDRYYISDSLNYLSMERECHNHQLKLRASKIIEEISTHAFIKMFIALSHQNLL